MCNLPKYVEDKQAWESDDCKCAGVLCSGKDGACFPLQVRYAARICRGSECSTALGGSCRIEGGWWQDEQAAGCGKDHGVDRGD